MGVRENIAKQLNIASKLNVKYGLHSYDCTVFRKVLTRTAATQDGGMPTLGGLGVLDSEDEAEYTYEEIGVAKLQITTPFQTDGGNWQDNDESINYHGNAIEALIEIDPKKDEDGYFLPDKNDLVVVEFAAATVMTYQISGVTGSVSIPPFTRRYQLNPRQDIDQGI